MNNHFVVKTFLVLPFECFQIPVLVI